MPDDISITIKGDTELIRALDAAANTVDTELIKAAEKSDVVVHRSASTYPPQRPGSRYRRTRRLGNSWATEVKPIATGVMGIVSNPTEYAGDVMGTPGVDQPEQAPIHKGLWSTTAQILKGAEAQILGFFTAARDRIVELVRR